MLAKGEAGMAKRVNPTPFKIDTYDTLSVANVGDELEELCVPQLVCKGVSPFQKIEV